MDKVKKPGFQKANSEEVSAGAVYSPHNKKEPEGFGSKLTYSLKYNGLIVGGMNEYHPEKMDIMVSRTIDFIPGESKEQLEERLSKMNEAEIVLMKHVDTTLAEKIAKVREIQRKKGITTGNGNS